ncbi:sugar transferase [Patescibacteria group bacterium]
MRSGRKTNSNTFNTIKRGTDLVGGSLLLLIFSPVILATAIAIKIGSPGPILVERTNKSTKRVGKGGKTFRFYKFRSMIVNAFDLLKKDPKFKKAYKEQQTAGNYKIMDDPRITPIGKFIRKHSIDEIPQLANVVKGEMSIVGPRPYLPDELVEQQKKFPGTDDLVKEMLTVKPGITGYWQVSGRSDVAFDKRIEMDAYYARKKSIWLDVLILIKTPWVMISGKGAA